jgi:hypothetical protein
MVGPGPGVVERLGKDMVEVVLLASAVRLADWLAGVLHLQITVAGSLDASTHCAIVSLCSFVLPVAAVPGQPERLNDKSYSSKFLDMGDRWAPLSTCPGFMAYSVVHRNINPWPRRPRWYGSVPKVNSRAAVDHQLPLLARR